MELVPPPPCEWIPCGALAINHVVPGPRDLTPIKHPLGFEIVDNPRHRDLCSSHLAELAIRYSLTSTFELGQCPDCHLAPPLPNGS